MQESDDRTKIALTFPRKVIMESTWTETNRHNKRHQNSYGQFRKSRLIFTVQLIWIYAILLLEDYEYEKMVWVFFKRGTVQCST